MFSHFIFRNDAEDAAKWGLLSIEYENLSSIFPDNLAYRASPPGSVAHGQLWGCRSPLADWGCKRGSLLRRLPPRCESGARREVICPMWLARDAMLLRVDLIKSFWAICDLFLTCSSRLRHCTRFCTSKGGILIKSLTQELSDQKLSESDAGSRRQLSRRLNGQPSSPAAPSTIWRPCSRGAKIAGSATSRPDSGSCTTFQS